MDKSANTGDSATQVNSRAGRKTPKYVSLLIFGAPLFFYGLGWFLNWIDPMSKQLWCAQMVIYTTLFAVIFGLITACRYLLKRCIGHNNSRQG